MSTESFDEVLPEDILRGHAVPPEMVSDLRAIAQIDAATVERITKYLSTLQGFATKESVAVGLQSILQGPNADGVESVLRTLLNVKQSDVSRIALRLDRWRQSSEERHNYFSDELFAGLCRNLKALVAEYPSIKLIRKAQILIRAVGNEFDDVSYFCDMRPVFDQAREHIEGFVMLANMRLMYRGQNSALHVFEVALTEEELGEIIKASQEALAKLAVLKVTGAQLNQGH